MPDLVTAACDDRVRSVAKGQKLAVAVLTVQLVVMNDVGRMLPTEAPKDLAQVILEWVGSRAANTF